MEVSGQEESGQESGFGTCRTCLRDSKQMQSIYKTVEISKRKEELAIFLKELTNLQFVQDDGLSILICQECIERLSGAISFKDMCLNSYNTLRGNIGSSNVIKIEEVLLEEARVIQDNHEGNRDTRNQRTTRSMDLSLKIKEELPDVEDYREGCMNEECPGNNSMQDHMVTVPKIEANVEVIEDKLKWWRSDGKPFQCDMEEVEIPRYYGNSNSSKKNKRGRKKKSECPPSTQNQDPDYKQSKGKKYKKYKNYNKPHTCPICGKVLIGNLKIHLTSHSDEKPFECAHCWKAFKNKSSLRGHIISHLTDQPYKCSICHQQFPTKTRFDIHTRTHTGEKPYLCPICGKGMSRKIDLNVHISTHSDERPYECEICKKTFKTKGNLYHHGLSHTKRTRFECAQILMIRPAYYLRYYYLDIKALNTGGRELETTGCLSAV
ncbi:zinc finger protein 506-like isoform X2 [Lutzomyia longipalpis]|uniref:zinc finger protein 506-like isoform X2 n=1 Tax=Lutzomyia longipalpis TaxID=7200 RepID=UPI0024846A3C|nr:zinc finger protein 506-like isoform X2 [Lutzomyia longipalpis]